MTLLLPGALPERLGKGDEDGIVPQASDELWRLYGETDIWKRIAAFAGVFDDAASSSNGGPRRGALIAEFQEVLVAVMKDDRRPGNDTKAEAERARKEEEDAKALLKDAYKREKATEKKRKATVKSIKANQAKQRSAIERDLKEQKKVIKQKLAEDKKRAAAAAVGGRGATTTTAPSSLTAAAPAVVAGTTTTDAKEVKEARRAARDAKEAEAAKKKYDRQVLEEQRLAEREVSE